MLVILLIYDLNIYINHELLRYVTTILLNFFNKLVAFAFKKGFLKLCYTDLFIFFIF